MHCSRSAYRNPQHLVRVVRSPSTYSRQASFFPTPFFPRAAQSDLAPLFRLFDDFNSSVVPQFRHHGHSFQPRFDVREVGNNYELQGELPGIDGKDIEVEFTDPQTLIVRGKTEKQTTSGTPPAPAAADAEATKAAADAAAAAEDNSDAASTYSTGSYQKPSVEDDAAEESSSTSAPAAEAAEATEPKTTTEVEKTAEQPKEQSRYWVSERTVGSFQRVFNFPSRVDQDAVKASLKNGILSITVPKAAAPVAKKIDVE